MKSNSIVWSWRDARFGAVSAAIPVVVIIIGNVEAGLGLLLGALPALAIGVLPTRAQRKTLVVVGALFGASLMLGSFIAQWVWVAIPGMFLLALGASLLASRTRFCTVALNLCVPVVGVGLSYRGLENSIGISLLMICGSLVTYGWSLCFKEYDKPLILRRENPLMNSALSRSYGILLGITAATATAAAFALGTEHIGWIVGASLFVMRPQKDVHKLRSIWRVVSVFAGAVTASWLLEQSLQPLMIAFVSAGALIAAFATHASRWYITPAFTTFLVFWALLYGDSTLSNIEYHFNERVLGTLLGVSLAYLIGIMVPSLASRIR